jgi:hypothetical protein
MRGLVHHDASRVAGACAVPARAGVTVRCARARVRVAGAVRTGPVAVVRLGCSGCTLLAKVALPRVSGLAACRTHEDYSPPPLS